MPATTRAPHYERGDRVFVWTGRITQMFVYLDLGRTIEVHAYGKIATTTRSADHVFDTREDAEAYAARITGRA